MRRIQPYNPPWSNPFPSPIKHGRNNCSTNGREEERGEGSIGRKDGNYKIANERVERQGLYFDIYKYRVYHLGDCAYTANRNTLKTLIKLRLKRL